MIKNHPPEIFFREIMIPEDFKNLRLDQILAHLFPEYSRTRLQGWLKAGYVSIDDKPGFARQKCEGGEKVVIKAMPEKEIIWQPQKSDIHQNIIYEDDNIIIINKPVGLVVHPGAGNAKNTLANQLLGYLPELSHIPRAGIVHRLDKNTSGLLIVAKTLQAQIELAAQLQKRHIHREYIAVAVGVMISGGKIDANMGRHPVERQKMAVVLSGGKEAVTHYRVIERFRAHTLIKVVLETGRTHQIRVHLAHKHYPLMGDVLYGARTLLPKYATEALIQAIRAYKHQVLHARKLSFAHPVTGKFIELEAPIPAEMEKLILLLRENKNQDT